MVFMKGRLKVNRDELLFLSLSIVWFLVAILFVFETNYSIINVNFWIKIFCWASVFQLIVTLLSIRRLYNGKILSLYLFFFLFLYIFSFGQFIMWAFGFHYISEMTVSHHVRYIDQITVLKIQTISLELISVFHLAVLNSTRKYNRRMEQRKENSYTIEWLRVIACPIMFISWIINLFYSVVGFKEAAVIGYSALFEQSMPAIIKYVSYMFVPSLFLVLITSKFSKRWFYILTCIFLTYAIPLLITGDRGSWIYFLGPWLWLYIRFVNTPEGDNNKAARRRSILSVILVVLIFFISSVFVSVRGEGYANIRQDAFNIKDLYTPFIKPFFEMGQSARILGIILQDNLHATYHYGNTYIADILGMILPRVKVLFGFPSWYVENWMSTDYLHMVNYGVGFSTFAEAYLNGGFWFSWIYTYLFGFFIGKMIYIRNEDVKCFPIKTFIALSTAAVLGPCVRATMDLWLREFFWGVLFVILIAKILQNISYRNSTLVWKEK